MSAQPATSPSIVIIGGGPAGLMAAEVLSAAGLAVEVFDAMPSVGRKFLMAGKGGMNITHSEPAEAFVARYGARADWLAPLLADFGPLALRDWIHGLGVDTFVGSSGRVFPTDMKAAPLLRAWLHRLREASVKFHVRHRWLGWDATGALRFTTPQGEIGVQANAVVLALGGASWPQLGSDAAWLPLLAAHGVDIAALQPANCGFDVLGQGSLALSPGPSPACPLPQPLPPERGRGADSSYAVCKAGGEQMAPAASALSPSPSPLKGEGSIQRADGANTGWGWSEHFRCRFAGEAVKTIAASCIGPDGRTWQRPGECVISETGLEGGLIYALSAPLRDSLLASGSATLYLDLLPGRSAEWVVAEVAHPRGARSLSTHLNSRLGLKGVKVGLLHECLSKEAFNDPVQLAAAIKHLPVRLAAPRPIAEVISTAGGVRIEALDERLMLRALPGVFCAGEMLDWEAPTGGYLLTGCFASGRAAGTGVKAWLESRTQQG